MDEMRAGTSETRVPRDNAEFYRLYSGLVKHFVNKAAYKAVKGNASALSDVEAAVWARMVEYGVLDRYDASKALFPAFVNKVVHNATYNVLRARLRHRKLVHSYADTHDGEETNLVYVAGDDGEGAADATVKADLAKIDAKLSLYFREVERAALYRQVLNTRDFKGCIMMSGLEPDAVRYLLEETI